MSYLSNHVYASSSPFSNTRPPGDETPSFHAVVDQCQLKLEDGTVVKPEILCKIEKGFFQSADGSWTCYRRNYFSVMLQYSLGGTYPQAPLYLTKTEGRTSTRQERTITEQVQALGVCLSAAVDGPNGKVVELIQHTPKRDKGPQSAVKIAKVLPTPAARVPRQTSDLHGYSAANYGVSPANSTVVQDPPLLPMQSAPDANSSDVVSSLPLARPTANV
jgi:meiosis-specific transcription factor NDT80